MNIIMKVFSFFSLDFFNLTASHCKTKIPGTLQRMKQVFVCFESQYIEKDFCAFAIFIQNLKN